MFLEILEDAAEFALIIAAFYFALSLLGKWRPQPFGVPVEKHRLLLVFLFVLAVTVFEISEEVLEDETGPVDEAILLFIRQHLPASFGGFFQAITFTGGGQFLTPLTVILSGVLWFTRQRLAALVLGLSAILGALTIYVIKTAVGRARPALWETDWYWGSSFPSGHTLQTAVTATALVLCAIPHFPKAKNWIIGAAIIWTATVGFSRLVLGVHWPTDVLTAACLGVLIPFLAHFVLQRFFTNAPRQAAAPSGGELR